jgi:superfamily I DNA and/or RNA helicase
MPPQIGSIISKEVYDSKLQSWTDHPITSIEVACHFIDVGSGRGVTPPSGGTSLIVSLLLHLSPFNPLTLPQNTKEKDVIILLASKMQEDGLSYRIITPYDAQRDLIEKGLQENGIDWHDRQKLSLFSLTFTI